MNVTLRCDQSKEYIEKAQELYVPWKRRDILEEIHNQYPEMKILLDISNEYTNTPDELNEIKMYSALYKGNLTVKTLYDYFENETLIKRVLSYPMRTIYEMKIAYSHGIRDFYIGTELLHQLNKVSSFKKQFECSIRCIANLAANNDTVTYEDKINGSWILPQEVVLIEPHIDYIEFESDNAVQEAAYYRIYIEDRYWGGAVKDLIRDFDCDAKVRMIEPREYRFKCGLTCAEGIHCSICNHLLNLANPDLYIKKEME